MSAQNLHASVLKHFTAVDDPRLDRRKLHQLPDILFITLCGIICGADNWVMVEQFGKGRQTWFKELLELPNGIPSHDTFGDVLAAIDTKQFSQCFSDWVKDLTAYNGDTQVIAIDGKTLRRSADKASKKAAIHMVSAWAQSNALVLGQVKVFVLTGRLKIRYTGRWMWVLMRITAGHVKAIVPPIWLSYVI